MPANANLTVGVVGLGLLGSAISERLRSAACQVHGYDIDEDCQQRAQEAGVTAAASARDVFRACSSVILSLPDSSIAANIVRELPIEVVTGRTVIDTTTGDPEQMTALSHLLGEHGCDYIEATVAGSSDALRSGDAVLFLGGEESAIHNAGPLLDVLSRQQFHLGPVGSASRFKLVHNLVLGLHRAVLAEGLEFAASLGFDRARVLKILRQTPAASAVMATKGERMVTSQFAPQARLSQHLKDVRLILQAAERTGATLPLSTLHQSLLSAAESAGLGDADNSAVIEVFRRRL